MQNKVKKRKGNKKERGKGFNIHIVRVNKRQVPCLHLKSYKIETQI